MSLSFAFARYLVFKRAITSVFLCNCIKSCFVLCTPLRVYPLISVLPVFALSSSLFPFLRDEYMPYYSRAPNDNIYHPMITICLDKNIYISTNYIRSHKNTICCIDIAMFNMMCAHPLIQALGNWPSPTWKRISYQGCSNYTPSPG